MYEFRDRRNHLEAEVLSSSPTESFLTSLANDPIDSVTVTTREWQLVQRPQQPRNSWLISNSKGDGTPCRIGESINHTAIQPTRACTPVSPGSMPVIAAKQSRLIEAVTKCERNKSKELASRSSSNSLKASGIRAGRIIASLFSLHLDLTFGLDYMPCNERKSLL
jgi:hypothetical protein